MSEQGLEFTQRFQEAYDRLENSSGNIFITGKAGTGKSTLLRHFRRSTKKKIVVLAPTGVAALNVGGQTIHSFFCFKPDITPDNVHTLRVSKSRKSLYKNLEAIVIDEISMVRADLFDAIDVFLRTHGLDAHKPFGGVQMIFFGDLFQLPPVVTSKDREALRGSYPTPYFFNARIFEFLDLEIIELDKIFRQNDHEFIELLGLIRNRRAGTKELNVLNQRLKPDFSPPDGELYVYLATTNKIADEINLEQLEEIDEELFIFEGECRGEFQLKDLSVPQTLEIKVNAQVMLLNNDSYGRWINGTIGKVVSIQQDSETIDVELEDGDIVSVNPHTWEVFEFVFNEDTHTIESKSVGSFRQFPLRLSWAITIHKSQGKTFNKVILDIGSGTFAHGQLYVALSRCKSLDGLILKKPIYSRHILLDNSVLEFMGKVK